MLHHGFYQVVKDYDGLLVDFDGTVLDSERIHAEIGVRILNENGVPDMTFEERYGMMGYGEYKIHAALVEQGRAPTISAEQFKKMQAQEFIAEMERITDPSSILRKGFEDIVDTAVAAGKPIYIVSNTATESVIAGMKAAKLLDRIPEENIFAFDYFHENNIPRKSDPAPYIHVKEKASEKMAQQGIALTGRWLALEDSKTGFDSAHGANCDTINIYYDKVGFRPDPRATYNVPDSQCLRSIFSPCACGESVKMGHAVNGIAVPSTSGDTPVPACR